MNEKRLNGQTIEQWKERAEISERNFAECADRLRECAVSETVASVGETPRTDALEITLPQSGGHSEAWGYLDQMTELARTLERELAEAKAEIKGWDDSYARWCVLMVKRGVHAFGFLDDAINALYDRAIAAENSKAAAVRAAKAYEWGYEYVKDRMKSIGRDGWAHDCDDEIRARSEGK